MLILLKSFDVDLDRGTGLPRRREGARNAEGDLQPLRRPAWPGNESGDNADFESDCSEPVEEAFLKNCALFLDDPASAANPKTKYLLIARFGNFQHAPGASGTGGPG